MLRLILAATLCTLSPAAFAATSQAEICATAATLAAQAAQMRRDGDLGAEQAMAELARRHAGQPDEIVQLIPAIAGWIYSLDAAQADPAAIGAAFRDQCMAR